MKTPDGRTIETDRTGQVKTLKAPNGTVAHFNNGHLTSMHKVGPDGSVTDFHRSPTGVHVVKTVTPDPFDRTHTVRTVSDGHRGYRERDLLRKPGYRQRTYYANGHAYAVIYHEQTYRGYVYPAYVPAYTYSPGFYAWYGSPWAAPVPVAWVPAPGYGGYFVPAPAYSSPSAWTADYMINQNLQANAAAQQDAQQDATADATQQPADQPEAPAAAPQPIPQAVRDVYVQEVQSTVQQEQAAAGGQPVPQAVPGALSPDHKLFQSYSDVEATDANGQECALTGGDFVQREEDTPDAAKTVAVTVVAVAKPTPSHCPMNSRVRLAVDTLQDWYNSYSEQQAAGLEAMTQAAGKNGIPPAPNPGKTPNPMGQGTPDDSTVMASAMQQQQTEVAGMQAQVSGSGQ